MRAEAPHGYIVIRGNLCSPQGNPLTLSGHGWKHCYQDSFNAHPEHDSIAKVRPAHRSLVGGEFAQHSRGYRDASSGV